jgi:adenine phosphoribosyltransferase
MDNFQTKLKNSIRVVKDFPKEGINFMDITTVLNQGELFNELIEHLYNRYKNQNIDFVAGIESRGFIFGAPLAMKLNCGFVPIRKAGKLPSETYQVSYDLEYGSDTLEIHKDAFQNKKSRVLLIDDLLATGGTSSATVKLVEKTGSEVIEAVFIINLKFLNGEKKLSVPVYSVLDEV